ncbi:signal transduction histidine kinase [Pseudomonas duriflava]|uniref:histidine kinase n=1 Tax=Pseudomonas duriflava TaxID=459528 RepID=A0A562QQM2_9PSED|nr:HAMP domain-containing sensor histidine kinase [Pseudomonas duriflava]TWI58500.1 signal transduction histidine kinase [Pseudomonas duriflava]
MEYKQSLSRRIIIAFVLMTMVVGGLFSFGIVEVVHLVEEQLISEDMSSELSRMLRRDMRDGGQPDLDPGMRLYYVPKSESASLPPHIANLRPGFSEVEENNRYYYAWVRIQDGRHYVLLQDQSDFERREKALYRIVFKGFLLSVALSGLLGWLLARRVIAPVSRLARQVRHRDQMLSMAPPLAPDYAHDEVGELAAAFDDALGQLRNALTREQLFTSDVSHELRTPLMVIATSCELLAEDPTLSTRGKAQLQRMADAAEEMRDLVQTFLQLARAQGDVEVIAPRNTLRQVADELVSQWRGPIETKGLRLDYQPDRADLTATFNAPFLRSVMSNLLRNALHYTEAGTIRLILDDMTFSVEDTGSGIPDDQHQAVFQPFVRGQGQRGEGLGLGLSLVHRICQLQGWTVSLTNRVPQGCRFQIKLTEPASMIEIT